jgi:hypothetical protein
MNLLYKTTNILADFTNPLVLSYCRRMSVHGSLRQAPRCAIALRGGEQGKLSAHHERKYIIEFMKYST